MPIHPTAIVSPKAELDSSVDVGPQVIIEDHVRVAAGTRILARAHLCGYTEIGRDNEIHMGAILGHDPQDTHFERASRSFLKIGDRNIFREYCTVHRGTQPDSATTIGNDNFLMGASHVAHNCEIGNKVIICNCALIAGHVRIGDGAFISGGAGIHQFVQIGRMAMCSGNSRITMDVPPFLITAERNEVWGLNLVGLKRSGVSANSQRELKQLFKIFYRSGMNGSAALAAASQTASFASAEAAEFLEFVRHSPNGIVRATRRRTQLSTSGRV